MGFIRGQIMDINQKDFYKIFEELTKKDNTINNVNYLKQLLYSLSELEKEVEKLRNELHQKFSSVQTVNKVEL